MDRIIKANQNDLEFIIQNLEDIKDIEVKDEEIEEIKNRIMENNQDVEIDPNLTVFKKLIAIRTYLELYGNGDRSEIQDLIDKYAEKYKNDNS